MVQNQTGLFLVRFCKQPHFHVPLFLQLRPPALRLERPHSGAMRRSQAIQKAQTGAFARCVDRLADLGCYFFILTLQCHISQNPAMFFYFPRAHPYNNIPVICLSRFQIVSSVPAQALSGQHGNDHCCSALT